ncbi:MAG: creatininase family protein [Burkholderiales bacterium]|nr:creatininase family protein [Anaerolineae bacterium]
MTVYHLETLFPNELQSRIETMPVLVLPFGTIEWHSYHLPLGLDGIVAQGIGERIADGLDAVLAPVSYWAAGGVPYPYTLKMSAAVIEPLLVAVFEQFGEMGFKLIVAFTGHFGLEQTLILKRAALTVMQRSPVTILPITEYDFVSEVYKGDHAGIGETSLLWTLRPDLVKLDSVPPSEALDGVLSEDPRGKASAERGAELLALIGQRATETVSRMLSETPVQRARYIEALDIAVRVLSTTFVQRQTLPKASVPSVTTAAYLTYCQAMQRGDYDEAKAHIERKFANLSK